MTIEYDRERRVYLDSDTGDYMTEDLVDREAAWYNFVLYNGEHKATVGIEAQEYVASFRKDTPGIAAKLQTIILKAWTPDSTGQSPTNRILLDPGDPRIDRISDFLRARRAHASRPETPVEYEIVFDPKAKKSVKKIKHGD